MKKSIQILLNYQQVRSIRVFQERTVRAMYWRARSFDAIKLPEKRRNQMLEWNYRSEIFAFSRRIQENLSEDTLRRVFAHPSYLENYKQNQAKYSLPNLDIKPNTDLTSRGQQLLGECLRPYLRYSFQRMPEDGIEQITQYLSSNDVLSEVANWIGCKEVVLSTDYPPQVETMANTVRALLAGIEQDLDANRARRFVVDMIVSYLNDKDIFDDVWIIPNPAETLNLILANSSLPSYEPRLIFQTGIKTLEPCHIVGLYVNQKFIGSSPGETLAIAEHCATLDALQRQFDLKEERTPFVYGKASDKIDYNAHLEKHKHIAQWQFKLV